MANTSALRKKGAPPRRENNPNLIHANPRARRVKNKPLQLMVPPDVFLESSVPGPARSTVSSRALSLDSSSRYGTRIFPLNHGIHLSCFLRSRNY